MYCPKCGNVLDSNAVFCPKCGQRIGNNEITKEINVGVIKDIAMNPNLDLSKKVKKKPTDNNNIYIVLGCAFIIILLVIILLLVIKYKKNYMMEEDRNVYCNENSGDASCNGGSTGVEEKEEFDPLDFSKYDFTEDSSVIAFKNQTTSNLSDKEAEGNNYCDDTKYKSINSNLDSTLNLQYAYTCGLDSTYLTNLSNRLQQFYKMLDLDETIVNSYLAGKREKNVYADFTGTIIGQNSSYIAYIKRIYLNTTIFKDNDKVTKTYERDLSQKFHPANSIPADIVVHETAHALNFYIIAKQHGIDDLTIDGYSKYSELITDWSNQTYAKNTVIEAAENVNNNYKLSGKNTKTVEQLREEISGYAASNLSSGEVAYCETFAEAMVDYLANGENAQDLSKEIYKIVMEDLSKL